MRRLIELVRTLELTVLAVVLLSSSAIVIGQQQPPTVTHPSTSNVQVSPQRGPSPYGNAPNPAVGVQRAQGAITGFVYWQMNVLQPSSSCNGLTVKVVTVSKSGMPLQLLSSSNTFTAMGPVTDTSAPGTPKYMLCSYAFQSMPENVAMRVLLYGAPSSSSVSMPSPFQIPGGNCNSTPSSTLSFILTGGQVLCGNGAFNINFKLTLLAAAPPKTTAPLLSGSAKPGGLLSNAGSASNAASPVGTPNSSSGATLLSSQANAASSMTSGTQTGLLSSPQSGANANSVGNIGGSGGSAGTTKSSASPAGFTGGVKPAGSSSSIQQIQPNQSPAATSGSGTWPRVSPAMPNAQVPKMPPMSSNAKRDASPLADAAERAQIQAKMKAQLASASQQTGHTANSLIRPTQSNVPEIHALQQQITFVNSLRTQGVLTNGSLLAAKAPNQVRIQPPQSSNPLALAPAPTKLCPAPQIHAVNGKSSGVVFTQDPAYNDYIITGCGFGAQQGQVSLSGAISNGHINLVVKPGQWSDTQIEAVVQPGLTGVLDGWPDLIVAPAGTPAIKFPNTRFYTQRQSVLLPNIPQQYANLANVPVGDGTQGSGTMYCPGPDLMKFFPCIAFNAGYKLDGMTNGVDHRNDTSSRPASNAVDRNGDRQQFDSGEDTYDLSYMAPGFQIDYASVFWYAWTSDVCEGWSSDAFPKKPGDSVWYETLGHYGWQAKTKTKIAVDWGVDHCAWRWLGMFKVDDWYNSGYSLQVYVKGPIGVDPWTGHPVSTARNFGQAQPNTVVRVP
jgi:hypothetical protein